MVRYGMPAEEMHRLDALAQADEDRYARMDERNDARIIKAVADLGEGFSCSLQGDPRGAVVRIHTPDGRDEGWGGVAVP
jgi:hypothetical protein